MRITRSLELRSYGHGLCGKADVVEFHGAATASPKPEKIVIVEYKRGRPKPSRNEEFRVQLCAQALCLEEMLGTHIHQGAIFFGATRHRHEVPFDQALRDRTLRAISDLHELIRDGRTPTARYSQKCRRCSLRNLCIPKALRPRATAVRYLATIVDEADT